LVRLACVDVPELALQLLLNRHPEWRPHPSAVVSKDSPGGTILSVNPRAREEGVSPGMRYAAGLSLTPELRAATVPAREIEGGVQRILRRLQTASPQVEPCSEAGLFWVDATGMVPLYPSLEQWVERIHAGLGREGMYAVVAVGFSRFGCYAAAKSMALTAAAPGAHEARGQVFSTPEQERRTAVGAPLGVLALEPSILERLELLGVRTVGEFLKLPSGGVRRRFGAEAERLHRFASGVLAGGASELPLQPESPEQEARFTVQLPVPSSETLRLVHAAARCLDSLLQATEARQEMLRELRLVLQVEEGQAVSQAITPAAPTRDRRLILELITLRLDSTRLTGPVAAVSLSGAYTRESIAQRELFVQRSVQARAAAAQAFARLRAVFGNDAVQRACLEDEHLPERSYRWENLEHLPEDTGRLPDGSRPAPGASRPRPLPPLVRRVFRSPQPLPEQPLRRTLGLRRLWGPYLLSGHWWEWEVSREYYYGEDAAGVLLWLYRDRHTRRWWIAGRVE